MRLLVLFLVLASCSIHRTKNVEEEKTVYEFSRGSILKMGYSSYMAGCVRTANKFGEKKYHPKCIEDARDFVKKEIDEIVFSD